MKTKDEQMFSLKSMSQSILSKEEFLCQELTKLREDKRVLEIENLTLRTLLEIYKQTAMF